SRGTSFTSATRCCHQSAHAPHHRPIPHPLFLSMIPPPPGSTLFPYTTLFRSPRARFRRATSLSATRTCSRRRRVGPKSSARAGRSEEHTSELQSLRHLVCRLLLEKKKKTNPYTQQHIPTPLRDQLYS